MSALNRILYVDDDSDGCEMMSLWLKQHSYCVLTAADGKAAKDLIQRRRFDLYILDYCLPDMTAVDLCNHIRSISAMVPILIYSALSRQVDHRDALSAGATKYLCKPNDLDRIVPEIRRLLGKRLYIPDSDESKSRIRRRSAGIL